MAGSGGGELCAPIFNGENYEFWSIRMKAIFKSHGIWELVERGIEGSDSKGADESDTKQKEKEESSGSGKMAIAEILMKDVMVTPTSATHNLEDLFVQKCDLLEVIFLVQETPPTQAFDKLRQLNLWMLPMLSHIWEKGLQVSSGFGNLRVLKVQRCPKLRYLFSPHIAKLLTCLERIEVYWCSAVEKIVGEAEGGGESIEDELTFPHVNSIVLEDLPELESFCSEAYTLKWPALEKVEVEKCPKLKAFAPESLYA
ncbi:hypothetical protein L3X38_009973 [Prunus dulcis]|uniref:Disease resistance protein At4g27190-like leucine-rich repeats domain-containing protein n=1 Tax=Prunus dulcis TaxID=3755 RepID=A0AAD4ZEB9_PRUDU|nr:hypothetical protein L3X38_009973 [Prunus dulcis]